MKSKILAVSIIVLLIAAGLVLISCTNPCSIEAGSCSFSTNAKGYDITSCSSSDCDINKFLAKYKTDEGSKKPTCSCK